MGSASKLRPFTKCYKCAIHDAVGEHFRKFSFAINYWKCIFECDLNNVQ